MADQFSPEAIEILQRGDPGVGHLDKIVKQYDIDYSHAQNSQDMQKADAKMIKAIDCLPGKKTMTECLVERIKQAKKLPCTLLFGLFSWDAADHSVPSALLPPCT